MPTENETVLWNEDDWVVRVRPPDQPQPDSPVMLLIHGLSGDENVMWIFTRNLPHHYWIIAPRGPVILSQGYAWVKNPQSWPQLMDFSSVAASLINHLDGWMQKMNTAVPQFDVMGFSQGAAMAYALSAFFPNKVNRLIALAGYLPQDDHLPGRYSALENKPVYIAHGTKDETIPVSMAEDAVQILKSSRAKVTYCESDTGHKLSANCLRGLEAFVDHKPV